MSEQVMLEKVSESYERRINPRFRDRIGHRKRKFEFNEALQTHSLQREQQLAHEIADINDETRRKQHIALRVIEDKHTIEKARAEMHDASHPKVGKVLNWFAEKSPGMKGLMTGLAAFVGTTVVTANPLGMLGAWAGQEVISTRLGRTNTDRHAEEVEAVQREADLQIAREINEFDGLIGVSDASAILASNFENQTQDIREFYMRDERAMGYGLLGGFVTGAAFHIGSAFGAENAAQLAES